MRITPIKTIDDVKKVYKFLTDRYNEDTRENVFIPFPLAETYVGMMYQVENNLQLQLKAEDHGKLMGFVTAQDKDHNNGDVYIQAIVVKKEFLKVGVGKVLLKSIEQDIKKAGYKNIKIQEREGSNVFFIKSGYIPYLYVYSPDETSANKVKAGILNRMEFVEQFKKDDWFVLKFDVLGEPVCRYKKYFASLGESISAEYIYEKKIIKR